MFSPKKLKKEDKTKKKVHKEDRNTKPNLSQTANEEKRKKKI